MLKYFSNDLDIDDACRMIRDSLERGIIPVIEDDNLESLINEFEIAVFNTANQDKTSEDEKLREDEKSYEEAREALINYIKELRVK